MPSRRSRSRSRRRNRRPSPSPSSGSDSGSDGSSPAARPPPKKAEKKAPEKAEKAPPARPAPASNDTEDMPVHARLALLEIEVETLRAENKELRRKLVEALSRAGRGGAAPAAPAAAPAAPVRRHHVVEDADAPPAGKSREKEKKEEKKDDRKEKDGKKDRREEKEKPRQKIGQPPSPKEEPVRRRAEPEEEEFDENRRNAVQLVDGQMEVYNESIANNIPLEMRLPLVNAKLERFMSHFDEKVQIIDLKSGKAIIKDLKTFTQRYSCVFRESGARLKGTTHKRFYYDASGKKATYALDFETHDSLVTATPGTPQDGKLGVRDPRTEQLAVMYEEKGGKITRMWLKPDTDKLGVDPYAGEDIITRNDIFKAFEETLKGLKGGSTGPFIFHNYHNIPTVG